MTKVADWDHFEIAPGFDLYVLPEKKFKTVTIKAYVSHPLGAEATGIALLPPVLSRGCRRAVNMRKMVLLLEELYGASLTTDVAKFGERHVLTFRLEVISDRYAPGKTGPLRRGVGFLFDLMLRPVRERGVFRRDYVSGEQKNLRRFIEGRINDRGSYALDRCIEEMCGDEPYGIYEYGKKEEIDAFGPQQLHDLHARVMDGAPIQVFVIGDVRSARMASMIGDAFGKKRGGVTEIPPTVLRQAPAKSREIVERCEVEQAQIVLGCRAPARDPFPMVFCDGVLGGFPHSKLFVNVREREGLAYSASSFLDPTKGVMFITAGIDPEKYDRAVKTIREQLDDVRAGKISDDEFDKTRKSLLHRIRSREDAPVARINSFEEMLINDRVRTPEQLISEIERVKKEDVARAAQEVGIDTQYFLTRPDGKPNE